MNEFDFLVRKNTRRTASKLVCVPLSEYQYLVQLVGLSSRISGGSGFNNTDRSGAGVQLAMLVPAGIGVDGHGHGARLYYRFWGTAFGLRVIMPSGTLKHFDVEIDGVAYGFVSQVEQLTEWGAVGSNQDGWGNIIVADDLEDCEHVARIGLYADMVTSVENRLDIMGFLLEERAGYSRPQPCGKPYTGTLTTGAVAITHGGSSANYAQRVTRIAYSNMHTSDVVVSIWYSTKEYRLTVKPNETVVWQNDHGLDGNYSHSASVTGVVNFMVIGGSF